ncbi:ECF transporter S component [Treponema sp. R6D11]
MKTRDVVISSISIALVFIATFFLKIPMPLPGWAYVNLGDVVIFLISLILPPPIAILASSLGSGMADLIYGAIYYIPATVIIKALMSFIVCKFKKKFLLATIAAGISMVVLYSIYKIFILGTGYAIFDIPWELGQAFANITLANIVKNLVLKYNHSRNNRYNTNS